MRHSRMAKLLAQLFDKNDVLIGGGGSGGDPSFTGEISTRPDLNLVSSFPSPTNSIMGISPVNGEQTVRVTAKFRLRVPGGSGEVYALLATGGIERQGNVELAAPGNEIRQVVTLEAVVAAGDTYDLIGMPDTDSAMSYPIDVMEQAYR